MTREGSLAPLVLVLPGLGGSGPDHWQTLWERRFPRHERVEQPDWNRPVLTDWLARLESAVRAADQPPVLVAHSLACALVAHAAPRLAGAVRAALLVAPADVDDPTCTPPETRGFAPMPLRPLPFPATVVASRTDRYVALHRARRFAEAWGAPLVDVGESGHINAESGLGDWAPGRALFDALLARTTPG